MNSQEWHDRYKNKGFLDNNSLAAVVTGTSPLSLGESIALNLHSALPNMSIITISRTKNKGLEERLGYKGVSVLLDLNPSKYGDKLECGERVFKDTLQVQLEEAFLQLKGPNPQVGIHFLFNNAGAYDFGSLTKMSPESINNLIGSNYSGHVMVAKAVMELNSFNGVDNPTEFRLCEVGSFQGLDPRAGRSVYVSSKSPGIDFCQSEVRGKTIEVASYIAPGPIDTHMLHYNLWNKAGGEEKFVKKLYRENIGVYTKIFLEGDANALMELTEGNKEQGKMKETFAKYLALQETYSKAENFATESVDDVGRNIVNRMLLSSKDYPSDIIAYNKRWNKETKTFFKGVFSRLLDPELPNGYDKLKSVINGPWQEIK